VIHRTFVAALRDALRAQANPIRAKPMQAYMKSAMPYLGITSAPLAAICGTVLAGHPLPTFASWRDSTLALWREAEFREERYAAIATPVIAPISNINASPRCRSIAS
jgi:3-methyladenine DNA glycosylase AlkD